MKYSIVTAVLALGLAGCQLDGVAIDASNLEALKALEQPGKKLTVENNNGNIKVTDDTNPIEEPQGDSASVEREAIIAFPSGEFKYVGTLVLNDGNESETHEDGQFALKVNFGDMHITSFDGVADLYMVKYREGRDGPMQINAEHGDFLGQVQIKKFAERGSSELVELHGDFGNWKDEPEEYGKEVGGTMSGTRYFANFTGSKIKLPPSGILTFKGIADASITEYGRNDRHPDDPKFPLLPVKSIGYKFAVVDIDADFDSGRITRFDIRGPDPRMNANLKTGESIEINAGTGEFTGTTAFFGTKNADIKGGFSDGGDRVWGYIDSPWTMHNEGKTECEGCVLLSDGNYYSPAPDGKFYDYQWGDFNSTKLNWDVSNLPTGTYSYNGSISINETQGDVKMTADFSNERITNFNASAYDNSVRTYGVNDHKYRHLYPRRYPDHKPLNIDMATGEFEGHALFTRPGDKSNNFARKNETVDLNGQFINNGNGVYGNFEHTAETEKFVGNFVASGGK